MLNFRLYIFSTTLTNKLEILVSYLVLIFRGLFESCATVNFAMSWCYRNHMTSYIRIPGLLILKGSRYFFKEDVDMESIPPNLMTSMAHQLLSFIHIQCTHLRNFFQLLQVTCETMTTKT